MKIQYFKGKSPNFGDDLNAWMWPQLLPAFFDANEDVLFVGIGSILGQQPAGPKKVVFGAGFVAQYNDPPDLHNGEWDVYFVRGPRTAKTLGLDPDLAVGDGAILLRTLIDMNRKSPDVVSFMPHWESLERGNWEEVCRIAGITLIDPRRDVEDVIADMLRSKLIVTEAMHGAIVADAFRIPWIPVLPIEASHREKWYDWGDSLKLELSPERLWPSSIEEAKTVLIRQKQLLGLLKIASLPGVSFLLRKLLAYSAAHRLKKMATLPTLMSKDAEIERVTAIMLKKVEDIRRDYG